MADYIWDTETFPNFHSLGIMEYETGRKIVYEISERKDEREGIRAMFQFLGQNNHRLVGFNSLGYDYPLEHYLLNYLMMHTTARCNELLYQHSRKLTAPGPKDWNLNVWESDWMVDQVDVFKISHFDNKNRATGLKDLEYAMRAKTIMDLPYDFREPVPLDGMDKLIEYMINHDVVNTGSYYHRIKDKMAIREDYSQRMGVNFTNHNDTKLGKHYTQLMIEKTGYSFKDDSGQKKQTHRKSIRIGDLIIPEISFFTPEFKAMYAFLDDFTITKTKEVYNDLPTADLGELAQYVTRQKGKFKKAMTRKGKLFPERIESLNVVMKGVTYYIGTGGLHACVPPCHAKADDEWMILDVDVTSFYPSVIIEHKVSPAHVGDLFWQVYADMKALRLSYDKGTPENAMLKLALNGTFGDLNSEFSVFYDPAAAMKITVNGQLMLMMLVESLVTNPFLHVSLLQANTDGITLKFKRSEHEAVKYACSLWEKRTKMELEHAEYSNMWISDVNNYIAKYTNGKLKTKGAKFNYDLVAQGEWSKNFSMLITQRAAVAYLTEDADIEEFIMGHGDSYDFTGRAKVQRTDKLLLDGEPQQRISRYYVSKSGGRLTKESPPLKGKDKIRVSGLAPVTNHKVTIINDTLDVDMNDIDYSFYIEQTLKSVEGIKENIV